MGAIKLDLVIQGQLNLIMIVFFLGDCMKAITLD
jgi:hypothetical protein